MHKMKDAREVGEAVGVDTQQRSSLGLDHLKRLRELEAENGRLRRAVSDLTLDKMILNEVLQGLQSRLRENDPE